MSMMDGQRWATPQRGLPVEDTGGSSARLAVTGETAAFYYSNSGTRTADAGQAAGTVVEAVLANGPIANSSGTEVATYLNSSLSFTSTAFTSEVKLSWKDLESLDGLSFADRLSTVQTLVANVKTAQANGVATAMANGDYVVDYRKGVLYGKKASTQTSLTSAAYTVLQKGGSPAITSVIPGTGATNLGKAEDSAHASGDTGVAVWAKRTDTAASSAGTDGDYATINQDSLGHLWSREGFAPGYENNTDNVAWVHNRPISSSTGAITTDVSTALEASTVSLAAPGRFYLADGYIDATAPSGTYYVQVLNASSLPADGAVTHLVVPTQIVHSTGQPTYFSIDRTQFGRYASTGVVVCLSSTQFTKTISGAYMALSVAVL